MKVLVLGGTGFIGCHLVKRLTDEGYDVVVPVRTASGKKGLPLWDPRRVQAVEVDFFRTRSFDGLMKGIDRVVHLAAVRGSGWGLTDDHVYQVNVGLTRNLLESSVSRGVKHFLYVSSVSVYGHPSGIVVKEPHPCSPVTRYGRTKYESEKIVEKICTEEKLSATIIRPVITYGPGDTWGMVTKLIALIQANRYLTVGDGKNRVHLIYIADLIEGLLLALNNPAASGRTYILAGEDPIRINELVGSIARALGKRKINLHVPIWFARLAAQSLESWSGFWGSKKEPMLTLDKIDLMCRDRVFDHQRAKDELLFSPKVGYEEGIARTVGWLRDAAAI